MPNRAAILATSDTTDYGPAGIGPASTLNPAEFDTNAYTGSSQTPLFNVSGKSGVYAGSLSAQGNMVAMQLNPGTARTRLTGNKIQIPVLRGSALDTEEYREVDETTADPYLTGYFRTYYKDPTKCTFGADSAMPALTLVVPASITDMQGNFLYYLDLQLTRLSGSNFFDSKYFINAFNQAVGWVQTSNGYVAALKQAEQTNLAYYGAKTYKDLITQGLDKYKTGTALREAFRNIGLMVNSVNTGFFGTANAVAASLISLGCGSISDLTQKLLSSGVNLDDIFNPDYTIAITAVLKGITDPNDLTVMQETVDSKIPKITSAYDYTSIEVCAARPNDSAFRNFAEVGVDLYQKAPNFALRTGEEMASLINATQSEIAASVEALSTPTSLLPPDIIANLKRTLPISIDGEPITLLNVIGSVSGYLIDFMKPVNAGIAALYATSYGPQIRQLLTDISRYAAQVALTKDEEQAVSFNPNYWDQRLNSAKTQYYSLLNTIVNDNTGDMPKIVRTINDNYLIACEKLRLEYLNYNKAGFSNNNTSEFNNIQALSFIGSLPNYGADTSRIATDYILYAMATNNEAGNIVRALLGQVKNEEFLAAAGFNIRGLI